MLRTIVIDIFIFNWPFYFTVIIDSYFFLALDIIFKMLKHWFFGNWQNSHRF